MNLNTFEGQWTRVRGEITSWWDKLTDADLEKVAGKKEALVVLVQEKYRYTRERAQQEVDRRLQEYSDKLGASGASRISDTVQETAQNVASSLAETAGEVKAQAKAAAFLCRGDLMLYWAVVFLIIALVAAVFGFGGIAVAAAGIAKFLFFLFVVIFLIMLVLGLRGRRSV